MNSHTKYPSCADEIAKEVQAAKSEAQEAVQDVKDSVQEVKSAGSNEATPS